MDFEIIAPGEEDFTKVLQEQKKPSMNKRDPRKTRLAAVTSAIVDISGCDDDSNNSALNASKMYASSINALENSLKDGGSSLDSLTTQIALLELIGLISFYVKNAILSASLPLTSRLLRGIIASVHGLSVSGTTNFETKDELGNLNAVLRSTCKASSTILQQLSSSSSSATANTKENQKVIKQLLHGTIFHFFHDERPKLRKESHNALLEILIPSNAHADNDHHNTNKNAFRPIILQSISKYFKNQLEQVFKFLKKNGDGSVLQQKQEEIDKILQLFSFLQVAIVHLSTTSELATDVFKILNYLLQQQMEETISSKSDDFVLNSSAIRNKDNTTKISIVYALLGVIMSLLDDGGGGSDNNASQHQRTMIQNIVYELSPRILATLLQFKPVLIFHFFPTKDRQLLYHTKALYGQVILKSFEHTMANDPDNVGPKLMPISLQLILQLCRCNQVTMIADNNNDDNDDDNDFGGDDPEAHSTLVVQVLMAELTIILRTKIQPFMIKQKKQQQQQQQNSGTIVGEKGKQQFEEWLLLCIQPFEQIFQPSFYNSETVSLSALSILTKTFVQFLGLIINHYMKSDTDSSSEEEESNIMNQKMSTIVETMIRLKSEENANAIHGAIEEAI